MEFKKRFAGFLAIMGVMCCFNLCASEKPNNEGDMPGLERVTFFNGKKILKDCKLNYNPINVNDFLIKDKIGENGIPLLEEVDPSKLNPFAEMPALEEFDSNYESSMFDFVIDELDETEMPPLELKEVLFNGSKEIKFYKLYNLLVKNKTNKKFRIKCYKNGKLQEFVVFPQKALQLNEVDYNAKNKENTIAPVGIFGTKIPRAILPYLGKNQAKKNFILVLNQTKNGELLPQCFVDGKLRDLKFLKFVTR